MWVQSVKTIQKQREGFDRRWDDLLRCIDSDMVNRAWCILEKARLMPSPNVSRVPTLVVSPVPLRCL
jgi:hypothetical protein